MCLNVRWGCGCVHVDGMNLKYVVHWHIHISSFRTMSVLYTSQHTQMHPKKTPFEDSEPTELPSPVCVENVSPWNSMFIGW